MKIFHHDDRDGYTAAAVIYYHYVSSILAEVSSGRLGINDAMNTINAIETIEMNYSKPWPIDSIDSLETVYIVDLSFTKDTADTLKSIIDKTGDINSIIWIDHHLSSIDLCKSDNYYNSINGLRSTKYCGAYLAWAYTQYNDIYNSNYSYRVSSEELDKIYDLASLFIRNTDNWDCFKKVDKEVRAANEAFNMLDHSVSYDNTKFWGDLLDSYNRGFNGYTRLINLGMSYVDYQDRQYEKQRKYVFYASFNVPGYEDIIIPVLNTTECNSLVFGDLYDRYPAVCRFNLNGMDGRYVYSIYSDTTKNDFDCHVIAEHFGGGGHKGAAGFSTSLHLYEVMSIKSWGKEGTEYE